MCGIAGVYSKNKSIDALNNIAKNMANAISHRGPDDSGLWQNECIALSHRRLSIIDLSNRSPTNDFKLWKICHGF